MCIILLTPFMSYFIITDEIVNIKSTYIFVFTVIVRSHEYNIYLYNQHYYFLIVNYLIYVVLRVSLFYIV